MSGEVFEAQMVEFVNIMAVVMAWAWCAEQLRGQRFLTVDFLGVALNKGVRPRLVF